MWTYGWYWEREKNHLLELPGLKILNIYWDKKDCGEAYIEFEFPETQIEIAIRDYDFECSEITTYCLKKNEKSFQPILEYFKCPLVSRNLLIEKANKFYDVFNPKEVTLLFFYEFHENTNHIEIINKALESAGKETKIIALSLSITDGYSYVHMLLKTPIKNINVENIDDFGSYCLGRKGWLYDHHIYGELKINSILNRVGENFISLFNDVANKKELKYRKRYTGTTLIPYEIYMDKNKIKTKIEINNQLFYF